LELSRLDSFWEDGEDDEPVLGVVSEWRGEVWGGGAMARTVVAVGVVSPSFAYREEEENMREEEGIVAAAERGDGLGFCGVQR
jgi:hypothetical protein